MSSNPNKKEDINSQNAADNSLNSSEWFGAIIRYLCHLGKKDFNSFYTPKQLKKNALVGYIFKIIMVLILIFFGYHYSKI
ncbi:hypothetical protein [Aquimarina mytili]|uniref:Uncharacterized protein n=1 Tax=Aquimarina mytili TaxID=874423 RepID=A0A936ZNG4_9FLAO|nr:hypothetical protein [Aquimarina mytili]MBL0682472.1 hypothetical protein [Aquimarina mytili]